MVKPNAKTMSVTMIARNVMSECSRSRKSILFLRRSPHGE
jgi:predicted choloylglycine hydrolase